MFHYSKLKLRFQSPTRNFGSRIKTGGIKFLWCSRIFEVEHDNFAIIYAISYMILIYSAWEMKGCFPVMRFFTWLRLRTCAQ